MCSAKLKSRTVYIKADILSNMDSKEILYRSQWILTGEKYLTHVTIQQRTIFLAISLISYSTHRFNRKILMHT